MGKTRKSFRHEDDEEENIDNRILHEEKHKRYVNRMIDKALKQKNVDAFVEDEEYNDDIDAFCDENDEEDYASCNECGIVLISDEDFSGAMQHISHNMDDMVDGVFWTCKNCLKIED